MAQVITLAKLPQGRDNKIELSEEQKQYYIDNNATKTMADIANHFGITSTLLYTRVKEYGLPKKVKIFHGKREQKFTEFFDWENATLIDPIFGLDRFKYY